MSRIGIDKLRRALTSALLAFGPLMPPATADGRQDESSTVTTIVVGGSSLVSVDGRIEQVIVVDDSVADVHPVDADEVLLVGRSPGTTDIVLRLESGITVTRRLQVGLDEQELESRIKGLFDLDLAVEQVGTNVAVRGDVPDVESARRLTRFMDETGMLWVDLTRIPGVRQVQLQVRIAEASRSALRQLAFGGVVGGTGFFAGAQAPGTTSPFQRVGISPTGGAPVGAADFRYQPSTVSSATTLFAGVPAANLEFYLQALDENRYLRLLAEPNLVAASGAEATFLVGGEFPVPVVQGSTVGGGSTVTVQYKEFGVRLVFRPEVLGDGRIRLEVAPEVSELSELGAISQNGFNIPSVVTRRSSTTVELGTGQSFAMAGLLRTIEEGRVSRVPMLGDLPVLGPLFRSVRYEKEETELVVIVTASLVEPLDDAFRRPVPGDLHVTPDDWELFVEGRLAGEVVVGTPIDRLKAMGLGGIKGPGAWRRPDDARVAASDPMPNVAGESKPEVEGES